MKIRKVTVEEEQKEKQKSWDELSGPERLEHHSLMLRRIYGNWESIPLEGQKVRKLKRMEDK
jgi:hypothetical protein